MNNDEVLATKARLEERVKQGDLEAEVLLDWYFGNPPARTAIFREFLDRQVQRLREERKVQE